MEFPNKTKQNEMKKVAQMILDKKEINLKIDQELFTLKGTNIAQVYTEMYKRVSEKEREAIKELVETGAVEEKKNKIGIKRLAFIFVL